MAVVVPCFLSKSGGACASFQRAALNLRIGSPHEWIVALVDVLC